MAVTVSEYLALTMTLSEQKPVEDQVEGFLKDKLKEKYELQALIPLPGGAVNEILVIFCKRA